MLGGMRPTSPDLRQRIVEARHHDGLSMGQIAARFKVPRGTVQNILERYRDAGTIKPRPANAGRRAAFEGESLLRLERDVERHPDATLAELLGRSGVRASIVAVHNTLRRMGFTRKKKLYVRASNSGPTFRRGARRG
jgi:transposase